MNSQKLSAEQVFNVAREISSPEECAGYLKGACGDDLALRAKVDALLRANDEAGSFLQRKTAASGPSRPAERSGQMIGRYKLLQEIGEGGFGSVWMAEQREPVKRRVALKIIKLGMDTKQVIARFEAERQALAMMDHPNIAKVLDAGATDAGRPYFAMEYVKGIGILEYCDTEKLDTKARLNLFAKVCHAIQHAHQKGIIHRDIKPSNVMITLHDGVPVPKVIDFGIAKATNAELTEKTLFTEHRQMIGTPAYMSPEQAEMSGLDIDTRSDIYSLGVLLYELLTGTTPFDAKELRSAGFEGMLRMIREQEPHKPSTRVASDLSVRRSSEPHPSHPSRDREGAVASKTQRHTGKPFPDGRCSDQDGARGSSIITIARQRRADPQSLSRQLRGDLDWIVMKCLEKDRSRRYDTANGLAADIKRHLSDEPVLASPPGTLYRLVKFVRRNHVAVTAGGFVAAALVIGLTLSTIGFVQASRDRDRAHEAKQVADQRRVQSETVTELLQSMLRSVDPHEGKGRNYTVRQLLDDFADGLDDRLPDQPEIEATIRTTIGKTYRGLGMYDKAEAHLKKAMEIRQHLFGDDHRETLASMSILAGLYQELFRFEAAEPLRVRQLKLSRRALGEEDVVTLGSMNDLAFLYMQQGRRDQAERLFEETFSACNRVLGDDHPLTLIAMSNLAGLLADKEQYTEAEGYYIKALELHGRAMEHPYMKRLMSKRSNFTGTRWQTSMMHSLARFYMKQGKRGEAEPLLERLLELRRRDLGQEHPDTLNAMNSLVALYDAIGRNDEAGSLRESVLEIRRRVLGDKHPDTLVSLNEVGLMYLFQGRLDEAAPLLAEAVELCPRVLGDEHPTTLNAMNSLAGLYTNQGKYDKAEPLLLDLFSRTRDRPRATHPLGREAIGNRLIHLYEAWGKPDKAAEYRAMLPAPGESSTGESTGP